MELPRIAVVIPTLTSPPTLTEVLRSLAQQTCPPSEVVIVAQRNEQAALTIAENEYPSARVICSAEGLSRARNAGVAVLGEDWDAVALPDDDVVYPDNMIMDAAGLLQSGIDGLCGMVLSASGEPRIKFKEVQTQINPKNVWKTTIEAGYILSRRTWEESNGFDEELGLGCPTPWQSGEGTDLLLRALERGHNIVFSPNIVMTELADASDATLVGIRKVRQYARGTGRVYGRRYNKTIQLLLVLKSFARVFANIGRLSVDQTRRDLAILIGRLEGLTRRTVNLGPR